MRSGSKNGHIHRALCGAAIVALVLTVASAQAGTVTGVTKSANAGSWDVGQLIGSSNNPSASYSITVNHTRSESGNAVTVNDTLPQGVWPGWTGNRSTGGFNCTHVFDNANKRYAVTCVHNDAPAGSSVITLPVWVDQLAVGSNTNTATASATGGASSGSTTNAVQPVNQVPAILQCSSFGGHTGANQFADNGTFGSLSANSVGNLAQTQNPGPALPAGATTMSYAPNADLSDGQYRLSNRLSKRGSVDANWFWTVGDHTSLSSNGGKGDPNQLMMVMNASLTPDIFYAEVLTVEPHTNYEFSTWAIHANNPNSSYFAGNNYAPLPFNISLAVDRIGVDDDNDGVIDEPGEAQVIATSGDVAASLVPTWRQYAAVFNSGEATQVRFIFRNNGPGGGGNDLAIDDMVVAACEGLPTGAVRGRLYYDDNRNDAPDGGESGLPAGISVELVNSSDQIVATAQTDAAGEYQFLNIGIAMNATIPNANLYTVRVVTTDSDVPARAVLGTANNVQVTVVANATQTVDFGFDVIRLLLRKQWQDAAINDAVTIAAASGSQTLRTFDATADSATELDVDATPVFVLPGSTVTISEVFTTGTAADYSQQLACTGATDTDASDGLLVNAADRDIVCTFTNARALADLSLVKDVSPGTASVGQLVTYTLAVNNAGSSAADNARVTDPAVAGIDCSAATLECTASPGAACPATGLTIAALQGTGVVIPTFPANSSVTLTMACRIVAP